MINPGNGDIAGRIPGSVDRIPCDRSMEDVQEECAYEEDGSG